MDKRLLLAITLSVLVVIGYQEYLRMYYPQAGRRPPEAPRVNTPAATAEARPEAAPPELPPVEPRAPKVNAVVASPDVRVSTDVFDAELWAQGARLMSLRLKRYRATIDPQSPGFQLVSADASELPLGVRLRGTDANVTDGDVRYEPSASSLELTDGRTGEIVFRGELSGGARVEKRFRFTANRYDFDLAVRVDDAQPNRYSEMALSWVREPSREQAYSHFQGVEAFVGNKIRHFSGEELERGIILPDPRPGATPAGPVQWAGYSDVYFLSAIVAGPSEAVRLWAKQHADTRAVATELLVPFTEVSREPYRFTVYTGPKDLGVLSEVGHGLSRTVDLGWFGFVAEPMLRVLKFFHGLTRNYGIDIILLTVLIKVLFFPLTQKSFRSMQDLQKLQPELKKLQEKYKEDREQLNKEVMELYRRHKVNPLGGCLPMLLQMPIFIGLYNALLSAVELRHAPFVLWINDLSAPDRLPALPHPPLAVMFGYDIRIPVLTLLMGVSMLVQQKMSPPAADPTQQRMMMLMPLVFTVMFVNFPAGLVLYWLVNNILTIAQQAWMLRGRK